MVWVNLADGTVEYLNWPCFEYFGVPPERMFGWDWRQAVHPDDLPGTLRRPNARSWLVRAAARWPAL
jgi:hypothetical protein